MTLDRYYFKKNIDNSYNIYRYSNKTLILENFFSKNPEWFEKLIKIYVWPDIIWIINIFEENSIIIKNRNTFEVVETIKWFKNKTEIDEIEQTCFSFWEEIILKEFKEELSIDYILNLHKRIFWNIYSWAWKFRNIQVIFWDKTWTEPYNIRMELLNLLEDLKVWKKSKMNIIDIILNFEYRFILIHPFQNTNWRFARLLVYKLILEDWYYWKPNIYNNRESRNEYLEAMVEMDKWFNNKLKQIMVNYLNNFEKIWNNKQ